MTVPDPTRHDAGTDSHAALVADLERALDLKAGLELILPAAVPTPPLPDIADLGDHTALAADLADTLQVTAGVTDILDTESGHANLVEDLTDAFDADSGLAGILSPAAATVLVVEDDVDFAGLITIMLEDAGFDVVAVARDGQEAVDAVDRLQPDLVTMDIMLPVMDGFEATEIISLRHPATRVVVVSAKTMADDVRRGMEAGAVEYLPKPFSRHDLVAKLRAHV